MYMKHYIGWDKAILSATAELIRSCANRFALLLITQAAASAEYGVSRCERALAPLICEL